MESNLPSAGRATAPSQAPNHRTLPEIHPNKLALIPPSLRASSASTCPIASSGRQRRHRGRSHRRYRGRGCRSRPSLGPLVVMDVTAPMAKHSVASMRPNAGTLRGPALRAARRTGPDGTLRVAVDTAALRRAATARLRCPPPSSAQSPPRLPSADSPAVDAPLAHTARFAVPDRPGWPWVSPPAHR